MRDIFGLIAGLRAPPPPPVPRAPKQHALPDMIGITGEVVLADHLKGMIR